MKPAAGVPPNVTAVASVKPGPLKPAPLIVTSVPTGPLVGVNEVIIGGECTVKNVLVALVPAGVVTLMIWKEGFC